LTICRLTSSGRSLAGSALCCLTLALAPLPPAASAAPEAASARRDYLREKEALAAVRERKLRALLAECLARAEKLLEEKRKSGNIAGTAAARTAVTLFTQCAERFEKEKTFELPAEARREISDIVEDCRKRQAEIESNYAVDIEALDFRYAEDTGEETPPAEIPPPPQPQPAPGSDGAAGPPPQPDTPQVMGSQGPGENWVTFARWEAEVYGLQVFHVKVLGRFKEGSTRVSDPIVGKQGVETYLPVRVIPVAAAPGCVFRVMSVPGMPSADPVRWPEHANRWSITLRVRPQGEVPSRHAVELQVSSPEAAGFKVVGADGALTEPAPAQPETNAAPAEATPPPESRGGPARAEQHDFRVPARPSWRGGGVRVRKGDEVEITAAGTWSCGSGGESVDANGYPRSVRFAAYYANPDRNRRQLPAANFGALLMRVGPAGGPVMAIGTRFAGTMAADGELQFDINEEDTTEARGDNRGNLDVRILVKRPLR